MLYLLGGFKSHTSLYFGFVNICVYVVILMLAYIYSFCIIVHSVIYCIYSEVYIMCIISLALPYFPINCHYLVQLLLNNKLKAMPFTTLLIHSLSPAIQT